MEDPETFAWNGLSLSLPEAWVPGALGKDYVRLDDDDGPVLELRWRLGGPALPMPKRLARVGRAYRRAPGFTLEPESPTSWAEALQALQARGVQTAAFVSDSGPGAVLVRDDGHVLAQAYAREGQRLDRAAEVLAGLRLDSADLRPWAAYGMAARVPARFGLAAFSFRPGHFRLHFEHKKTTLTLERLAPADVILGGRVFMAWAEGLDLGWGAPIEDEGLALWRHVRPVHGLGRLVGKRRLTVARMRHEALANKLLRVAAEGPAGQAEDLETLCRQTEASFHVV